MLNPDPTLFTQVRPKSGQRFSRRGHAPFSDELVELVCRWGYAVAKKENGADFSVQILRVEIMGFERLDFRFDFGFCAHAFAPTVATLAMLIDTEINNTTYNVVNTINKAKHLTLRL
jgi:hypothetical protein